MENDDYYGTVTASPLPKISAWDLLSGAPKVPRVSNSKTKSKPKKGQGLVHVEEGCTQPDQNAYKHSIAPSSTGEAELLDIYNCHSLLKKRAKHLTNKAASLAEARDETMSRIMQIEELASTFDNFTMSHGAVDGNVNAVGGSAQETSGHGLQREPASPQKGKRTGYAPPKAISNLDEMDNERVELIKLSRFQNSPADGSRARSILGSPSQTGGNVSNASTANGSLGGAHSSSFGGEVDGNTKIKNLPYYDGNTSWSDFIHQFELLVKLNRWGKTKGTSELIAHLRGDAQSVLADLPEEEWFDYEMIKSAMATRFEPASQAAVYRAILKGRKRNENESLPALAHDIRKFYRKGYPQYSGIYSEVRLIELFTDALTSDMMSWYVVQSKPVSLDKAVQAAIEYEAYFSSRQKYVPEHKMKSVLPEYEHKKKHVQWQQDENAESNGDEAAEETSQHKIQDEVYSLFEDMEDVSDDDNI